MDNVLQQFLVDYGSTGVLIFVASYGIWKLLLRVLPEGFLKKVKLFPRRHRIIEHLEVVASQMEGVSNSIGKSTQQNESTLAIMSRFIMKLEEVINNLNILDANIELWRNTIIEMNKSKEMSEIDQLRKVRLRMRLFTYEEVYRVLIYMLKHPGETDSLQGDELDAKIESILHIACKSCTEFMRTRVYSDLRIDGVPENYINCLEVVLFEKSFLKDAIYSVKTSLKMRGHITEQIEAIRITVENFHFNIVDKMEKLMHIYISNGKE